MFVPSQSISRSINSSILNAYKVKHISNLQQTAAWGQKFVPSPTIPAQNSSHHCGQRCQSTLNDYNVTDNFRISKPVYYFTSFRKWDSKEVLYGQQQQHYNKMCVHFRISFKSLHDSLITCITVGSTWSPPSLSLCSSAEGRQSPGCAGSAPGCTVSLEVFFEAVN